MKTKTNLIIICLLALLMTNASIETTAQIVYTDIPDTTVFIPNTSNSDTANLFYFDLNNDNITDYVFFIGYVHHYDEGHLISGKSIGIKHKVVNSSTEISGGCWGFDTNIINVWDTINNQSSWFIVKYIQFYQTLIPWECTIPVGDIFFGLKLVVNTDTLYGWVRCTATDSSITIKDYAYNSNLNSYILAGQTIVGVDIDSLNTLINIFATNGILTVDFNGYQPAQGNIIILNIAGQIIKGSPINGAHNLISLNTMSSGIYIVRIETPEIVINKKMYLQAN
jgi:hypothetical protein